MPDDFSTPGEGVELLPCPSKLPHDLEPGQLLARRFGPPYNTWYMGKIDEVNRRRTKSENVSVAFNDTTHGGRRAFHTFRFHCEFHILYENERPSLVSQ